MATAATVVVPVIVSTVIRPLFKTHQARLSTRTATVQEEQFRRLAERAAESPATATVETARTSAELQALRGRTAAMERILPRPADKQDPRSFFERANPSLSVTIVEGLNGPVPGRTSSRDPNGPSRVYA